MNYYGNEFTKKEVLRHTGRMEQFAGIRSYICTQGPMDGIRMHEISSGDLSFTVMESRGMDILDFKYKGMPLNFLSKAGAQQRAQIDPVGMNFLRGITGGMVYTCGLNNVGAQCESEEGIDYFHGRMRLLPAEAVSVSQKWEGDAYTLSVSGEMRETGLFRNNMVLRRTVSTEAGSKTVRIESEIENEALTESPLMMMLHVNCGFPMVSSDAKLYIPAAEITPMNPQAKENREKWDVLSDPIDGAVEQVYVTKSKADPEGNVYAGIYNPKLSIGLSVEMKKTSFPNVLLWKSMGSGDYVCGIQPTNGFANGRDFEEKNGTLQKLAGGEKKKMDITLRILDGEEDLARFLGRFDRCTIY